jgi:multidrug efflux system membrane fusion protein
MRQVEVGQYLTPGAPIVTLTDLSMLYVNFTLPSQMRPQIAAGQQVNVTDDAYPERVFTATITTIEPQVSADTRTMQIQATLANPDEALLPGMFVNAAVVLPSLPDTVMVPETAVDFTLYGDSVFVIRPDGTDAKGNPVLKAHRTAVKIGGRWNGQAAILDGLKPGDRVVAAGQVKVQDGGAVVVTGAPPPQPPATPTPN